MELKLQKIIKSLVKDPLKIISIADAWVTAINPSTEQKDLAEARWNICVQCIEFREKRDVTGDPYCNDCGCPLKKKIFSKKQNTCPLKKWEDVDNILYPATQKSNKSLL
jgi:hypothetical protein